VTGVQIALKITNAGQYLQQKYFCSFLKRACLAFTVQLVKLFTYVCKNPPLSRDKSRADDKKL
jgi:hypothetical protein